MVNLIKEGKEKIQMSSVDRYQLILNEYQKEYNELIAKYVNF